MLWANPLKQFVRRSDSACRCEPPVHPAFAEGRNGMSNVSVTDEIRLPAAR